MIRRETSNMRTCTVQLSQKISKENAVLFAQEIMEIVRDDVQRIVVKQKEIHVVDFKGLRTIFKVFKILRKKNIQIQFSEN